MLVRPMDSASVHATNPEEYKCVLVTNDMLKSKRKPTEGLYNTVIRNIQAVTLFVSVASSFNRLLSDWSPRRPAQSARLSNVEAAALDMDGWRQFC